MARMTKAAKAKRDARNAKRREVRGNQRRYRDTFAKTAERMGIKQTGELSPRQTARVNAEIRKQRGGQKLLDGARVVDNGRTASVGSGE